MAMRRWVRLQLPATGGIAQFGGVRTESGGCVDPGTIAAEPSEAGRPCSTCPGKYPHAAVTRKLKTSCLCPHCWHRFRPEDTLWIAADPELGHDRMLREDDPIRFLPSRFTPFGEALDPSGARTRRLACPRCHLEVPRLLLERPMVIMSLAGSPSSGKSYFLASAAWQLRQDLAKHFHVSFTDTDPEMNAELAASEERLFLNQDAGAMVALDKTELSGVHYSSVQLEPGVATLFARPHMFTARPVRSHVNGHAPDHVSKVFTLYDNAGEHFFPGADTSRQPGTQHLARAQVLMFLFDPTQDIRFRQRLAHSGSAKDPQVAPDSRAARQDHLLVEMARRIRVHGGLGAQERIPKPLFLILSKSDVWDSLLRDGSGAQLDVRSPPYFAARPGLGGLSVQRVDAVSARVRALLLNLAPELVASAEDAFERVVYVPVSSLGTSPQRDAATGLLRVPVADIAPRWVTVPFVYTIARWSTSLVASDLPASPDPSRASAGQEAD